MSTITGKPIQVYALLPRDPDSPDLWQLCAWREDTHERIEFPPTSFADACAAFNILIGATRPQGWFWCLDELAQ